TAARHCKLAAGKPDTTFPVAVTGIVSTPVTEFSAKPESVLSARVGNIVHSLVGLVGSGQQGPAVIAAKWIEAVHINFRHSKIDRVGYTRIDFIHGRRIRGVIHR